MNPKTLYPIAEIYKTIQGEGENTGNPIILIRFSTPVALKNAHLQTTRETDHEMLTAGEILCQCEKFSEVGYVHLTGDDPTLNNLYPLVKVLKSSGYLLSIDTCGAFHVPEGVLESFGAISLGPKPGVPVNPKVLSEAEEYRFYINSKDPSFWELAEEYYKERNIGLIIPYTLSQDDIDLAISFVFSHPGTKLHIPLYRAMPNFDINQHGGHKPCDICLQQDQKETV